MVPDQIIMYTNWAVNAVKADLPEFKDKHMDVLYHGVDTTSFYRLSNAIVSKFKEQRGWADKFVITSVNRYQPRKALPLLFRAVALFQKGYKKCSCGNIYLASKDTCDLNGCGPESVRSITPGVPDTMFYVHANREEYTMGPGPANTIEAHLLNAGFVDADTSKSLMIFGDNMYINPMTEADLNLVYNASDINVSTSIGEGWGLSLIEAMSCGVQSIAPKNSAIPEVLGDTGYLVPNSTLFNIAMDSGHMRPIVDIPKYVEALTAHYNKWVEGGRKRMTSDACIERVQSNFLWDDKREKLRGWIKSHV
jgi:glycosyltransferase involved in cell wall biosynthesis